MGSPEGGAVCGCEMADTSLSHTSCPEQKILREKSKEKVKERWAIWRILCNFDPENTLLEMYVNDGTLSL